MYIFVILLTHHKNLVPAMFNILNGLYSLPVYTILMGLGPKAGEEGVSWRHGWARGAQGQVKIMSMKRNRLMRGVSLSRIMRAAICRGILVSIVRTRMGAKSING